MPERLPARARPRFNEAAALRPQKGQVGVAVPGEDLLLQ